MQTQGKPLPAFFCSITGEIMRDPVATADGQTFERAAIERWLERNDTSPATGLKLPSKTLVPNIALRQAVEEWEQAYALHVRRADIELEGPALAAGSFKTVYRGTLRLHVQGEPSRSVTVAVLKMRRGDCATEARTFLTLGRHPKLVRFWGQCIDGEDHILLTEFAPLGSLSDNFERWEGTITLHHNLFILEQIAEGMAYLIDNGIVHRDVAARNVLVSAFDPQVVSVTSVKITDYGLSANMYNRSHVTVRQGQVPYRYLSEEAILKGRFGEASDVWAFGVLVWELLTLGYIPYAKITDDQKVVEFVTGGGRLSKEEVTCECPDSLWSIVVRCWSKTPKDRPTFSWLLAALQTLRDEEVARKKLSAGNELAHDGAAEGAQQAKEAQERADAELARRLQRELQVEAEQEAGARGFERSLAALERQRDVASIVNGMLKFSDDEAVQKAACRSLLNLTPSVEGDEYQKIQSQDGEALAQMKREYRALASAGVLDVVRQAISAHSAEVACAGCRILKLLARDDENNRKIGAQGGIEALVTAMGRHAESPDVQEYAARALYNIAADAENRGKIGAQGGIEALVTAMGRHAESPDVQEQAAWALGNLAADAENRGKIGAQGGIEALVTAMGRHAESPDVQEKAALALGNLAANHPENHRKIGAQGGIEALVTAMGRHAESPGVQEHAARALRNIAANHAENKRKIGAQGGIETLVTAMGRHAESPGVQEKAVAALCNLADRSDLQQRIKRAGAGEAVRRAMAAPGATANTKTWGQRMLDALKKV